MKEDSKATMGRQILITSSDNEDERTSHQGSSMPSQASKYAGSSNFFFFTRLYIKAIALRLLHVISTVLFGI